MPDWLQWFGALYPQEYRFEYETWVGMIYYMTALEVYLQRIWCPKCCNFAETFAKKQYLPAYGDRRNENIPCT